MSDTKYLLELSDRHASAIAYTGYQVNNHTVSFRGPIGKIARRATANRDRVIAVTADLSRRVRCPIDGDSIDLELGYGACDLWFLCGSDVVAGYGLVGKCGRVIMVFRTVAALSHVYYQISKNSRKSWRNK